MVEHCFRLSVAALVLIVIAFEDTEAQKSDCALRAVDSVYLAGGPVYRDCAVDKKVRVKNRPRFVPPAGMPTMQCMAAEFEFVVDTVGRPEIETVRKIRTNDPSFADATAMSIQEMTFTPAMKDGARVRQIYEYKTAVTVQITGGTRGTSRALRPHC